jgi:hypoxanthine-guanine phosphoribosyltransferase
MTLQLTENFIGRSIIESNEQIGHLLVDSSLLILKKLEGSRVFADFLGDVKIYMNFLTISKFHKIKVSEIVKAKMNIAI